MLDLCYTVTFTCAFNLENREAMSGKKVVVSTVGPSPAQVRALQRLSRALVQIVEFSWPNWSTSPESLRLSTGVVLALCGWRAPPAAGAFGALLRCGASWGLRGGLGPAVAAAAASDGGRGAAVWHQRSHQRRRSVGPFFEAFGGWGCHLIIQSLTLTFHLHQIHEPYAILCQGRFENMLANLTTYNLICRSWRLRWGCS